MYNKTECGATHNVFGYVLRIGTGLTCVTVSPSLHKVGQLKPGCVTEPACCLHHDKPGYVGNRHKQQIDGYFE